MLNSNPIIKQTPEGVQLIFQFSITPINYEGCDASNVRDPHYRTVIFECENNEYQLRNEHPEQSSTDPKAFHYYKLTEGSQTKTVIDFNSFHFEAVGNLEPSSTFDGLYLR